MRADGRTNVVSPMWIYSVQRKRKINTSNDYDNYYSFLSALCSQRQMVKATYDSEHLQPWDRRFEYHSGHERVCPRFSTLCCLLRLDDPQLRTVTECLKGWIQKMIQNRRWRKCKADTRSLTYPTQWALCLITDAYWKDSSLLEHRAPASRRKTWFTILLYNTCHCLICFFHKSCLLPAPDKLWHSSHWPPSYRLLQCRTVVSTASNASSDIKT
jgi:hypothetical protein